MNARISTNSTRVATPRSRQWSAGIFPKALVGMVIGVVSVMRNKRVWEAGYGEEKSCGSQVNSTKRLW